MFALLSAYATFDLPGAAQVFWGNPPDDSLCGDEFDHGKVHKSLAETNREGIANLSRISRETCGPPV
jgi:hypothetical protein